MKRDQYQTRKKGKEPRTLTIPIRFSQLEHDTIQEEANKEFDYFSSYVRRTILNYVHQKIKVNEISTTHPIDDKGYDPEEEIKRKRSDAKLIGWDEITSVESCDVELDGVGVTLSIGDSVKVRDNYDYNYSSPIHKPFAKLVIVKGTEGVINGISSIGPTIHVSFPIANGIFIDLSLSSCHIEAI